MTFFSNFPKTNYKFPLLQEKQITDFFYQIIPIKKYISDIVNYEDYEVIGGDRPDIVSLKLYGTPEYYWTFFIINEHLQQLPLPWALSSSEMRKYLSDFYDNKTCISLKPKVVFDAQGRYLRTDDTTAIDFKENDILTGYISRATGRLISKENDLQQLIVENISGKFLPNEIINSNNSINSISSYKVYDLIDAPYQYLDQDDRVVDNEYLFNNGEYSNYRVKTYGDMEHEENSKLSKIKYIHKNSLGKFITDYKKLIGNLK